MRRGTSRGTCFFPVPLLQLSHVPSSLWVLSIAEMMPLPLLHSSVHPRGKVLLDMAPCAVFDPKFANQFQTELLALYPSVQDLSLYWSPSCLLCLGILFDEITPSSFLGRSIWAIHFLRSCFSEIFILPFYLNDNEIEYRLEFIFYQRFWRHCSMIF